MLFFYLCNFKHEVSLLRKRPGLSGRPGPSGGHSDGLSEEPLDDLRSKVQKCLKTI